MHQLFRKKNIVPKLLLGILYLLFFAVQLNLRYQSVDVSRYADPGVTSIGKQTIALSKVSVSEQANAKSSVTVRLNKRFFPGYFYIPEPPVSPFRFIVYLERDAKVDPDPFFTEQHTRFTKRRGPPSLS